jgi:hypothetical protein
MVSNILAINRDFSVISQKYTAENRPSRAVPLAIMGSYSQSENSMNLSRDEAMISGCGFKTEATLKHARL